MKLKLEEVDSFPLPQFHQLGRLCCRRLAHLTNDKRFFKALKRFEQALGPPLDERLRRDAYNAAYSAYCDERPKHEEMTVEAAVLCTLVCACENFANANLLGNFESALSQAESLSREEIRKIEEEFLHQLESAAAPDH